MHIPKLLFPSPLFCPTHKGVAFKIAITNNAHTIAANPAAMIQNHFGRNHTGWKKPNTSALPNRTDAPTRIEIQKYSRRMLSMLTTGTKKKRAGSAVKNAVVVRRPIDMVSPPLALWQTGAFRLSQRFSNPLECHPASHGATPRPRPPRMDLWTASVSLRINPSSFGRSISPV